MTRDPDRSHMLRAIDLALEGWGRVAPNPLVGAVVVRDGVIVGEGYHAEWGGPHAEVAALEAAGAAAHGATIYVTLEPCHHEGKTGPCTRAIVEAGIHRVVYGAEDVNPVAAGGAAWLRRQGVKVDAEVCGTEARDLNAIYFNAFADGRPFVALKYAVSLDGRLSAKIGEPSQVTGPRAIAEAHRLRAGHEAVMVGIGTVLSDDPQLTVREWDAPRVPPVRVILDSDLRMPLDSLLVRTAADVPVWVFGAEDAPPDRASDLESRGVTVILAERASTAGGLELGSVFAHLSERGIRSLMCEGGGTLGSSLLTAGLVDRLYLIIAPKLFGSEGTPGFQLDRDGTAPGWRLIERLELGVDTLLALSPAATV